MKSKYWSKKKNHLRMGNLEEQEYRRREQHILRDEKEELKEIKEDIIQKLKLMKISGFETLEEFLRSGKTKLNHLSPRDLKELNKQYKKHQYKVLEKLLEFKYFKGELNDLLTLSGGGGNTLLSKRDDLYRFGGMRKEPINIGSDYDEKQWGERRDFKEGEEPRHKNGEGKTREGFKSEERVKFPTREKRRVLIKVSKYLKKNHAAKVIFFVFLIKRFLLKKLSEQRD